MLLVNSLVSAAGSEPGSCLHGLEQGLGKDGHLERLKHFLRDLLREEEYAVLKGEHISCPPKLKYGRTIGTGDMPGHSSLLPRSWEAPQSG